MKVTATRTFEFDAAHCLDEHAGKCRFLHGHRYKIEVTVTGEVQPVEAENSESGMIIDFGTLKEYVWDAVLVDCDHGFLNDYFPYTTAEMMAPEMFKRIEEHIKNDEPKVELVRVRLWETPNCYVTVERDNG